MGTGMVFWLQASQFQMCMSVPQMAEVWMRIRTSLGPIVGTGTSSIQSPGSRLLLTSAFMAVLLFGFARLDAMSGLRPGMAWGRGGTLASDGALLHLLQSCEQRERAVSPLYCQGLYLITPRARPTFAKAAMAASMSAALWAADIWVRMRAWPLGTTGKKKPVT